MALALHKVQSGITAAATISKIKAGEEKRHEVLLALVAESESEASDTSSWVGIQFALIINADIRATSFKEIFVT